jgi:hypothetical protein
MREERCSGGRAQPVEGDGERSFARRYPVRRAQPMMRGLFALALLCAGAGAIACPLCLGAFQQSKAQELVSAPQAVLAVPTADASRFRVVDVVKGERPAGGTVEGGYPRNGPALGAAVPAREKPLLLIRDDTFPTWTILGAIGADHLGWLRKLAAGKPAAEMSPEDWRARAALVLPYLESREPLASEIAYAELATAPYPALRTLKSRLDTPAVRRWVADPERLARQPLYLLLLGIAGNAQDAAGLEQRLDAAWTSGDSTNVGPMVAADLELKGPARMAWVDERYMRDQRRSTRELEAALLALSVQGNANDVIPRERVIQSYRTFIKAHREIAGFVAQDLAAWQYWDAVPEYIALMKSSTPQQYPSRIAIVAYLRQYPNARAIELPLPAITDPPGGATRAATAVGAPPK